MSKKETVEVTLKLPKPFYEFYVAFARFLKKDANWKMHTKLHLPSFLKSSRKHNILGGENLTYVEKVEKIAPEDRDYVDSELYSLAQWLKSRYPDMNREKINRFIRERLNVSV